MPQNSQEIPLDPQIIAFIVVVVSVAASLPLLLTSIGRIINRVAMETSELNANNVDNRASMTENMASREEMLEFTDMLSDLLEEVEDIITIQRAIEWNPNLRADLLHDDISIEDLEQDIYDILSDFNDLTAALSNLVNNPANANYLNWEGILTDYSNWMDILQRSFSDYYDAYGFLMDLIN